MTDDFFEVIYETPTAELELSTELRCREVMKSNDIEKVKRFCCNLMRNQAKVDAVLAAALGRLVEYETKINFEQKITKAKGFNKFIFGLQQRMMRRHIRKILKQSPP
tara:strand:+ start:404 stop:724 length:321 start_codon:yes stop_codon:yes gene_type:complete